MSINEEFIIGQDYTMLFPSVFNIPGFKDYKEYFGKYLGIVSEEVAVGYPGHSMTGTGQFKDMYSFDMPARRGKTDGCLSFDIGHFIKHNIVIEKGDTTK